MPAALHGPFRVRGVWEYRPLSRPAQVLTASEAHLTPSDAPPGMLPRPGTDAFPPSAPHTVPGFSGTRWPATLSRWWREAFGRNPYARGGGATGRGPGAHRPFAHLMEHGGDDRAIDQASPGEPAASPAAKA